MKKVNPPMTKPAKSKAELIEKSSIEKEQRYLRELFAKACFVDEKGDLRPFVQWIMELTDNNQPIVRCKIRHRTETLTETEKADLKNLRQDSKCPLAEEWRIWLKEKCETADALLLKMLDFQIGMKHEATSLPAPRLLNDDTPEAKRWNDLSALPLGAMSVEEFDEFHCLSKTQLDCPEYRDWLEAITLTASFYRKLVDVYYRLKNGGAPLVFTEEERVQFAKFTLTSEDLSDFGAVFRNYRRGLVTLTQETARKKEEELTAAKKASCATLTEAVEHLNRFAGGFDVRIAQAAQLYVQPEWRTLRKVAAKMSVSPATVSKWFNIFEKETGFSLSRPKPGENFSVRAQTEIIHTSGNRRNRTQMTDSEFDDNGDAFTEHGE